MTTGERILHLLKSRGPMTSQQTGEALGMTAAGAQQQLSKLASDGLIEPDDRRQDRGRPKRYWQLTGAGHGRFPDRHGDLTLEMLSAVEAVFGADGLNRLIAKREADCLKAYTRELMTVATLKEKVATLARIRAREGYMADWETLADGRFMLVENHCPICAAATKCQNFCRSELQIFQSLLAPLATVERSSHILAGARRCAYLVTPVD